MPARLRGGLKGLRRLPFRARSVLGHDSAVGGPTAGLLAGCVMDPWFGRVHDATIALLEAAGYRVLVPEEQGCCGALAAHGGAAEAARQMAAVNSEAFADVDLIVSNAAGCSAHLNGYGHWGSESIADRAVDAIQLVARAVEDGRLPTSGTAGRVAVHDPCRHRHARRIIAEPRIVLRAAGYETVDVDPTGMCCGAAGQYSIVWPEAAGELGRTKAEEVIATDCEIVASANPGCEIQLRSHLGDAVRVGHPLELYAEALGFIPRSE